MEHFHRTYQKMPIFGELKKVTYTKNDKDGSKKTRETDFSYLQRWNLLSLFCEQSSYGKR